MDSSLCDTEEILDIKSMHQTTTGKDIFENVCQSLTHMKLPLDKLIGLTTNGVPMICSEKSGLVGRMRVKMQEENCTGELKVYHCIRHQETPCGKVLKMEYLVSTVTRTVNFIQVKGLNHQQFQSLMQENAFRVCQHSLSYRGALAELRKSSQ